jgi:hypothetical protein
MMNDTLNQPSGKVIFSGIKQLPDHWWSDHIIDVWQTWDKNTYYLWGANQYNFNLKQGQSLMGAGMAGLNGPTRGYAHDHYIGLDTMNYSDTRNPDVFKKLETWLLNGKNVVVPIHHGCLSLGTGIGGMAQDWSKIQLQIFEGLLLLIQKSNGVVIPPQTFWPDCRVLDTNTGTPSVTCSICLPPFRDKLNIHSKGITAIKEISDIHIVIKRLK